MIFKNRVSPLKYVGVKVVTHKRPHHWDKQSAFNRCRHFLIQFMSDS